MTNIAKEIETLWHNFSKKEYYLFLKNYEFSWDIIPEIEDFIIPVNVKIIWIIPNKELLFKLEVKNKNGFKMRLNSDELYLSKEDCLEDNKNFLEEWNKKTLEKLEEQINKKSQSLQENILKIKELKDNHDKLLLLNNNDIKNLPLDKTEFLLRCANAWDKWEITLKSLIRGRNATEKLLREESWIKDQLSIVNSIIEQEKEIAWDKYWKLAWDIDLYNIEQFFYLLLHPCPICARDEKTWDARYWFCDHKKKSEKNINF